VEKGRAHIFGGNGSRPYQLPHGEKFNPIQFLDTIGRHLHVRNLNLVVQGIDQTLF